MNNLTKLDLSNMSIMPSSTGTILFSMLLAFAIGLFIFWVYKMNYKGVMYSQNFALTLVMMTLITTPVVMCIRNSIQLSMGMVGALSIVRFRTAVKDPLDTAYMFWALTMGILLGAGQFFLAGLATVAVAVLSFVLNRITSKAPDSFLLVVRCAPGAEAAVTNALRGVKHQKMKSRTVTPSGSELTLEVRVERQEALMKSLMATDGVRDATLVAYQSETL
jgi:uncharacterized membrane protein YhiD involved in acid resistance